MIRSAIALAGVSSGERSFGRPYNNQMEPARPMVLCDHVAEARGSFGALYGQRKKVLGSFLHSHRSGREDLLLIADLDV